MSTGHLSVTCLGALLLIAPSALAQPLQPAPAQVSSAQPVPTQRVAIVRLDFEGKIPAALQELFAQRLVEGLSAARFEVLRGSDVEQRLAAAALSACRNTSCYPAIAAALAASYLITANVSESNKTYTIIMEIINGRTGGVLATNRERCETCGVEEAGEKMGLAASALRERLEVVSRDPARIIIRSRPAGAAVVMDGRPIGVAPLDVELPGGPHHVQLNLRNHDPLSRSFTVVGGVDEVFDLDLVALPSKFPYRAVGWGSLAGGAALLVAGIATMTLDNEEISCSDTAKDVNGHCPWIRSTNWWAASMIGLGVAAATAGGFFLYLAPPSGSAPATASAGVSGTF